MVVVTGAPIETVISTVAPVPLPPDVNNPVPDVYPDPESLTVNAETPPEN